MRFPPSIGLLNLGNLWRRLALPHRISNWSLTSLRKGWSRPVDGSLSTRATIGYYWRRAP